MSTMAVFNVQIVQWYLCSYIQEWYIIISRGALQTYQELCISSTLSSIYAEII